MFCQKLLQLMVLIVVMLFLVSCGAPVAAPVAEAPPATATPIPPPTPPPTPLPQSAQPTPLTRNLLTCIWGSSGRDVFAVGLAGTILHYDGTAWLPQKSGIDYALIAVWGSSDRDVFAVGENGTILHYGGEAWSPMDSGTRFGLWGVWGNSDNDVFAFRDAGLLLHYDGKTWSPVDSSTNNLLVTGWGSSDQDIFVVGWGGTIVHYDGRAWSRMKSETQRSLWGVWGSSGRDVFAVGSGGTIMHYDGNVWSLMNSGTTKELNFVWGSSDHDVFAVGDGGTILHYDGKAWSPMNNGTTNGFDAVWGSSGSDVFAVGDDGTILHYDGKAWADMSSGTPVALPAAVAPTATAVPARPSPETRPLATQAPPAQAPNTTPSAAPSAATPAADLLALVKAFQDTYNRQDVDAIAGLFAGSFCQDWETGPKCWYAAEELLRYDAALNSTLELSDCRIEGNHVTCKATQRNDCLTARGVGQTRYASVVFTIQNGKIALISAVKMPEDAQRDLLFLYMLGGWAHRTRPKEWDKAGRGDLLDDSRSSTFDSRTGAVMSALCKEYATAAAATTPSPVLAPPQTPSTAEVPGSVLFIGDSSSLGLDGMLPKLAASVQPSITVASKLNWHPGVALGGQYEFGTALDDIRQGKWDVVVLQDDLNIEWPNRAAEFTEYARKFDQAIKQVGAETVFYMVYPYKDIDETTTKGIVAAYRKIGQDLGVKVAPVSLAFSRALKERPDLDLYADGEHPSEAGIYLEACVLYTTIFGRSPVGLTYHGSDWQISEKDAADLQRIAWETVQEYQAQQ